MQRTDRWQWDGRLQVRCRFDAFVFWQFTHFFGHPIFLISLPIASIALGDLQASTRWSSGEILLMEILGLVTAWIMLFLHRQNSVRAINDPEMGMVTLRFPPRLAQVHAAYVAAYERYQRSHFPGPGADQDRTAAVEADWDEPKA